VATPGRSAAPAAATQRAPLAPADASCAALNQLSEVLRGECAMAGYTEVLTWALCSAAENFAHLRRVDDGRTAVEIGNPATAEFEVCRTSLLPAALKTLGANRDTPLHDVGALRPRQRLRGGARPAEPADGSAWRASGGRGRRGARGARWRQLRVAAVG
jgi:hypothetical protein